MAASLSRPAILLDVPHLRRRKRGLLQLLLEMRKGARCSGVTQRRRRCLAAVGVMARRRSGDQPSFRFIGQNMIFTDSQLQKCYQANMAGPSTCSDELRPISALTAAHDTFRMLEGPHSTRVHEAIQHLLLPGCRPALRHWYQRPDAADDPDKVDLRRQLSQLTGEAL